MGELLLTVFIVVLLWGGRFPRVGLCTVTGFTFWASFDAGSRVVLAPGAIDNTTVAALLVLVMLGGIFPNMDVFSIFEEETLEPAISPRYALITLSFLAAGLATGALASTAWGA